MNSQFWKTGLVLLAFLVAAPVSGRASAISLDEDVVLHPAATAVSRSRKQPVQKKKEKKKKAREDQSTLRQDIQQTLKKDEKVFVDLSTEPPEIRPGFIGIRGTPWDLPAPVSLPPLGKINNNDKVVTDPNLKLLLNRLMTTAAVWELPADYQQEPILGEGEATRDQAAAFIRQYNRKLPIKASPEQIVEDYYEEAGREGIRWDVALCQALVETGFFHFGGTVVPEQNNFCGLGTTSASVRGAYFATPRDGVRAHIQHLLAYTVPRLPRTGVIDPRYSLVHDRKRADNSFFTRWSQLNGKWATGSYYAEKILRLHQQMKQVIAASGYPWKRGMEK